MTDAMSTRAVREKWRADGRRLFRPGGVGIVALSAALFLLALRKGGGWGWLILSGTGPLLLALVAIGWLIGFWWMPRASHRRLGVLPTRQVTITFGPAELEFQTATERLAVAWSQLAALVPLPSFWLVRLHSGVEIPMPRATISAELLSAIRAVAPPGAVPDGPA